MAGDNKCAEHSGVSQAVLTMTERLSKMETRLERVDDRTAEIPALSAAVSQLVESQERLNRVFWGDGDRSVLERIRRIEERQDYMDRNGSQPVQEMRPQLHNVEKDVARILGYFTTLIDAFWKLCVPIFAGLFLWWVAAQLDLIRFIRP